MDLGFFTFMGCLNLFRDFLDRGICIMVFENLNLVSTFLNDK